MFKENFDTALKVGRPVARQVADHLTEKPEAHCVSECPLAQTHIQQGVSLLKGAPESPSKGFTHPIQVLAYAYTHKTAPHKP
jgi:glycerol-3-phosphate dehydrogenase subunit C